MYKSIQSLLYKEDLVHVSNPCNTPILQVKRTIGKAVD